MNNLQLQLPEAYASSSSQVSASGSDAGSSELSSPYFVNAQVNPMSQTGRKVSKKSKINTINAHELSSPYFEANPMSQIARKVTKKSNINAINANGSSRKIRTTKDELHSEVIGLRKQIKILEAREAKDRKSNLKLRDEWQYAMGRIEELKPFNNVLNILSSQIILKAQKNLEENNSNRLPAQTPNPEVFKCPRCEKKYNKPEDLVEHLEREHVNPLPAKTPNPEVFKCPRCEKKYNKPEDLVEHLEREHVNPLPAKTPNPVEYKCPRCDEKYNKPEDLVEHLEREHANPLPAKTPNPEEFKCQRCNKKYNKPEDLVEHLERVHVVNQNGNFECEICGKKFTKEIDLTNHSKDNQKCEPYYQREQEYRRERFQAYQSRDFRSRSVERFDRYERQDYRDYEQSQPQIIIKGGTNSFGKIGNSYNQYRKHKRY